MKTIITISKTLVVLLLLLPQLCIAQRINNIKPYKQGNDFIIKYRIKGNYKELFNISLYFKTSGNANFSEKLKKVEGDTDSLSRGIHKLIWHTDEEGYADLLEGAITFRIYEEIIQDNVIKHWFLLGTGSLDSPNGLVADMNTPIGIGLLAGRLGGTGWYLSLKRGAIHQNTELTYSGPNWSPQFVNPAAYYRFTGERAVKRLSYTGGMTQQLTKSLYLYLGAGYGEKDDLLELDIISYASNQKIETRFAKISNTDQSFVGMELEGGFILRIKYGLLSVGISSLNLSYANWTMGIGLNL